MDLVIDPLGHGLGILIRCLPRGADSWLSFASWYSIRYHLPDAKVCLGCRRPLPGEQHRPIAWAPRAGVVSYCHQGDDPVGVALARGLLEPPILQIDAGTMVLGPLEPGLLDAAPRPGGVIDGERLAADLVGADAAPLVRTGATVGAFVMAGWIDRGDHPFRMTEVYQKGDMTINHRRTLSLWSKLCPIYDAIG